MMSRVDMAIARVIGVEAGYVNDPQDPGGETKWGISKRSYPDLDIANLTWDQAKAIYLRDFWERIECDQLGAPVDEFLFDYAVNSGAEHAAMALQTALGVPRDGDVGPRTLAAFRSTHPRETLRRLFVDRAMTFAQAPALKHDGHGWYGRLFDKTELALNTLVKAT